MIHGDLKPVTCCSVICCLDVDKCLKANILMDQDGNPRLTDFGLSWIYEDSTIWETSRRDSPGTTRYMSPELLSGATNCCSEASDIYAYAMTSWVNRL